MFMGPWDQGGPWSPSGIGGVHRFLNRVWTLVLDPHGREAGDPDSGVLPAGETEATAEATLRSAAHRTLRDVTADYEAFHFNTMLAKLMELSNTLFRYRGTPVAGSRGVGRGDPAAAADAGAGRAAHHRGAVEPTPDRGRRAVVVDPRAGLARGRRRRDGRGDARGPGPGQRQAARQGRPCRSTSSEEDLEAPSWRARRSPRSWPAGRPTGSSTPAAASSSTSSSATDARGDRDRWRLRRHGCDGAAARRRRPRAEIEGWKGASSRMRMETIEPGDGSAVHDARRQTGHRRDVLSADRSRPSRGVNRQLADGARPAEHGRPDRGQRQAPPRRSDRVEVRAHSGGGDEPAIAVRRIAYRSWPDRRPRRDGRYAAGVYPISFGEPRTRRPSEADVSDVRLGALCWNQYTDWPSLLEAGRRADRLGYRHAVDVGPPLSDRRQLTRGRSSRAG